MPDKQEKRIYRMNGIISIFIVILIVLILESQHIRFIDFVLKNFLSLYISALLVGLTISVLAYIRSFYVPISTLNPHIINKGKIYNFVVGRELHPRIWNLDWKLLVIRNSIITKFLIDFCLLGDKVELYIDFAGQMFNANLNNLTPTCIVYFTLTAVYAIDGLIFEYTRVTSKELQQEAFGYYMGVRYFIDPFIASLTTKYILDHNIMLPYWELGLVTGIFLTGYLIYRGSNNQKDSFRKNPYSPTFSNLDTLPTTQGKKLLCSGFWGLVRHPNYLGHILIELSIVPFVLKSPLLFIILLKVAFLIHRSIRDNNHCKLRYESAWDRYCSKVRYYLIPKVY
ncbi:hypothetical protein GWI33_022308 [Rhynchophorus ferrugineus]|uniref:Steroid 5-alpha reductase C-terminal domain-containing protein n=1 Tax=Rhynchophorus ferrugineus TaxID=354439 RepID=A0A834MLA2_RHYFE|nr:hypothetical protein GWI33_022308 [Rhynchophorus ferrugineus]